MTELKFTARDIPEGVRVVTLSDTFAQVVERNLEQAASVLRRAWEDAGGV